MAQWRGAVRILEAAARAALRYTVREMRWIVAAVVAAALVDNAVAQACGDRLGADVRRAENSRYTVAFRTQPAPLAVGQHFAVAFVVCPKDGAAAPTAVAVDANMPAHKHGMNYRTTVTRATDGTWRADGLMFQMPGRWDLTFDVATGGGTQRLAYGLDLR